MATMAPPVTKGLNFTCQGLPSPNSMKGSSMPRPGLVLSAMAASGQPLFCFGFWSRACAARRRAGPRAAARRGGAGAAGSGGRATSGTRLSWRPVLFWRQAPLTSGCENGGNAQRPHSFGPARAEARRRARARDACRPRDSAEPSQTRPRGHPRSRGDRAGAGPSARRSVRCPAVAGRAPGSRPPAAKRVGRPPQKPPPCQSLGTHIQAKARKSASDSLCFQYRSAATTTTRKARRTQHN